MTPTQQAPPPSSCASETSRRISPSRRSPSFPLILRVVAGSILVLGLIVLASFVGGLLASSSSAVPPSAAPVAAPDLFEQPQDADADSPATDLTESESNGELLFGTTVFDHHLPGISKLNPQLLEAIRSAAHDAASDDIGFLVNSGWRSVELQHLYEEAVTEYGPEEAARWVALPKASSHVTGDAIDIGPWEATNWLTEHGSAYGLCQIYANEPWHFELRAEAVSGGCPAMLADPKHDSSLS